MPFFCFFFCFHGGLEVKSECPKYCFHRQDGAMELGVVGQRAHKDRAELVCGDGRVSIL